MMLSKRWMIGLLLLVVMAIPLMRVSAKGVFSQVIISGENIDEPIVVTDSDLLDSFAMHNFASMLEPLPEAPSVSAGYTITRGYFVDDSLFVAFDEATYYPNGSGELGYLYYNGLINGWSEFDGGWYQMTAQGEAAMQQIIGWYRVQHAPNWLRGVLAYVVELTADHIDSAEWWRS